MGRAEIPMISEFVNEGARIDKRLSRLLKIIVNKFCYIREGSRRKYWV